MHESDDSWLMGQGITYNTSTWFGIKQMSLFQWKMFDPHAFEGVE